MRHRLAGVAEVVGDGHRDVGHRHLPRTHHLVAADHAADRAIADRDQEGLVGDRRETQQPIRRVAQIEFVERRTAACGGVTRRTSRSIFGALPNNTSSGRSTGRVAVLPVFEHQHAGVVDFADHRVRAALARARCAAKSSRLARHRRRARSAPATRCTTAPWATCRARRSESPRRSMTRAATRRVRDRLRAPRSTGRPRRRRGSSRIGLSVQRARAAVDDLLRAPLDLRIATLHRGEIEIGARRAAVHRRRRAAAEADQHRGPAEHDDLRADRDLALLDVLAAHVAQSRRRS